MRSHLDISGRPGPTGAAGLAGRGLLAMVVWLYCSAPLPATARRLPAGLPHGSAATPADPVSAEAERLFLAARAAHATPHGPIELWRMNRLAGWLPRAVHDERLRQAATDEKATPLYRAMAWWLMRERAERRLDGPGTCWFADVARHGPMATPGSCRSEA